VSFTWLHDISREDLNGHLEYYGLDAEGFAAFLASLGVRTHEGQDKAAFRVLQQEATARGW
jgi:hypothetical protein